MQVSHGEWVMGRHSNVQWTGIERYMTSEHVLNRTQVTTGDERRARLEQLEEVRAKGGTILGLSGSLVE